MQLNFEITASINHCLNFNADGSDNIRYKKHNYECLMEVRQFSRLKNKCISVVLIPKLSSWAAARAQEKKKLVYITRCVL